MFRYSFTFTSASIPHLCSRFVQSYPFHVPIDPRGDGDYTAYVDGLMAETPGPVVWMVQGGSGIGNGLWGFVQAFAQSLLSGKEQPEQLS